jgi:hypothetical protein
MLPTVYPVDELSQAAEILAIKIDNEPWQMGNFRFITFLRECLRENKRSLGGQDIGKVIF